MRMTSSLALDAGLAASCAAVKTNAPDRSDGASAYTRDEVRLVQHSLNERGYAVGVTGAYDERTRAAVTAFQRSNGMRGTGEVDAPTARALGVRPSAVHPVEHREEPQDRIQEHAWTDGGA